MNPGATIRPQASSSLAPSLPSRLPISAILPSLIQSVRSHRCGQVNASERQSTAKGRNGENPGERRGPFPIRVFLVGFEPTKRRTRADVADVTRNFSASRTRWRSAVVSNSQATSRTRYLDPKHAKMSPVRGLAIPRESSNVCDIRDKERVT